MLVSSVLVQGEDGEPFSMVGWKILPNSVPPVDL